VLRYTEKRKGCSIIQTKEVHKNRSAAAANSARKIITGIQEEAKDKTLARTPYSAFG